MKLLALFALIYLSYCIAAHSKTTKQTTLSKTSTNVLKKLKKNSSCYQSFKGYYRGKYYNITEKVNCSTNCFSYKFKENNTVEECSGCSNTDGCVNGGYLTIKPQNNYQFFCCNQDLCNSPETNSKLFAYNCEKNKKLDKSKKLIFPSAIINAKGVQQCYYCDNCYSAKDAKIFNCSKTEGANVVYACQYAILYYGNITFLIWGCVNLKNVYLSSYSNINFKVIFCQTNLCNAPEKVKHLENATLCKDGFYA